MRETILNALLIMFLVSSETLAQASSQSEQFESKYWYLLGGYSQSVWSSTDWSDCSEYGSCVISQQDGKLSNLGAFSVSIGHQFAGWGYEIEYSARDEINAKSGRTVLKNGTIAQSGLGVFKTENLSINLTKDFWVKDDESFFGIIGIGSAEHYNDDAHLMVSGTKTEYGKALTTKNTSYQVGGGYRKELSNSFIFETRIKYSDLGKAYVWDRNTDNKEYGVSISSLDVGVNLIYKL